MGAKYVRDASPLMALIGTTACDAVYCYPSLVLVLLGAYAHCMSIRAAAAAEPLSSPSLSHPPEQGSHFWLLC